MSDTHHLTLNDRQTIESGIENGQTKAEIARILGKDPSGIGREIMKHREFQQRNPFNNPLVCGNRKTCKIQPCSQRCKNFVEPTCQRRDRLPGACNGCKKRGCRLDKYYYRAKSADARYHELLKTSREGINLEQTERDKIGETIAPLFKQNQSVYQILTNHPEVNLTDRTLYRYIENGVFKKFGIDNFSLKEQVNRKQFKEKYKKRKEPANYNGHKYADYIEYLQQNPGVTATEMDTVYNHQTGPFIQTFMFPTAVFMIGRIHTEKTSESMSASLRVFQERMDADMFARLFSLLLTDRGSEFEKVRLFEFGPDGKQRLHIFYCDAMQSAQKPHVENNHNNVRDIIPNGKPLDCLTQESVDLMFSHINSTPRRSLNGKTPYEMFSFFFGTNTASMLGIREIPKDEVILKPSLIFSR